MKYSIHDGKLSYTISSMTQAIDGNSIDANDLRLLRELDCNS